MATTPHREQCLIQTTYSDKMIVEQVSYNDGTKQRYYNGTFHFYFIRIFYWDEILNGVKKYTVIFKNIRKMTP